MHPPLLDWPLPLATANACGLFTLEKGTKDGAPENCAPSPAPPRHVTESRSAFCVWREGAYIKGSCTLRNTVEDISTALFL